MGLEVVAKFKIIGRKGAKMSLLLWTEIFFIATYAMGPRIFEGACCGGSNY